MKPFVLKKKSNFMQGLKSAILAIFQNGLERLCPVSAAPKNSSQEFKKFFLFWVPINP
jgi:hypothetical protein